MTTATPSKTETRRRLQALHAESSIPGARLGTIELGRSDGDYLGANGWTRVQDRQISVNSFDVNPFSNEDRRLGIRVHPCIAAEIVEDRGIGNDLLGCVASRFGKPDTHTLARLQALGTTLDLEVERIWCGRALNKHPLRPHRPFIFIVVARRHDFSVIFVVILAGIVIGIVSGVFVEQDADLYIVDGGGIVLSERGRSCWREVADIGRRVVRRLVLDLAHEHYPPNDLFLANGDSLHTDAGYVVRVQHDALGA